MNNLTFIGENINSLVALKNEDAIERWRQASEQLSRILHSKTFENSERLRKFLNYIVTETIEGREDKLKSYSIGIEVLNRNSDFDTTHDGIVRTTANRLRAALEKYYQTEGRDDPIVISLPKGRYLPVFIDKLSAPENKSHDVEPVSRTAPSIGVEAGNIEKTVRHFLAYIAAGVSLAVLALLLGLSLLFGHATQSRQPPIILIQATTALTDDERTITFARGFPVRLSSAMSFYDVNSVVRASDFAEANSYAADITSLRNVYVVTSEVGAEAEGLGLHWQLVDARTGIVLWSSTITGESDGRSLDILVQELVGENAAIRSAEQRNLPTEPVAGYVCVTHSLNKLIMMTDRDRLWMSKCLTDTVRAQPDYAGAWALLALVRIEDSIAEANQNNRVRSQLLLEEARKSYQNSQRLAPASWLTLRVKTMLEFQVEDTRGFETSVIKALAVLPENARERVTIASRLFAFGSYEQADTMLRKTIALMPVPQPSDYTFLAAGFYWRGAYDDALKLLRDQPVPDSTFYWCLLTAVAGQINDPQIAGTALRSLEQKSPRFSNILEVDLHNRHFRSDFVSKILSGFNKAVKIAG
ncbi:tetratricopeptide repeat protein [Agrobacterium tumefaciens]|uniref:tetratricopeptide repeat protein n=1 Tax=Agrobacterium tumefaciens TaxID=358 RepID=UPI00054F4499|nr:tetratricopeptide repeat protein [Agrobacterium tumefaciens]